MGGEPSASIGFIQQALAPQPAPTTFTIADLVVDTVRHKVIRNRQAIDLTRTEYQLLELLAQNSPRVVSRSTLIEGIWRKYREVTPGALDVLVNSLRGKLDAPFTMKLLHTLRGSGYLLTGDIRKQLK